MRVAKKDVSAGLQIAMATRVMKVPRAKRAEGLTDDVVKVRKEWHAHSV